LDHVKQCGIAGKSLQKGGVVVKVFDGMWGVGCVLRTYIFGARSAPYGLEMTAKGV